mgnify:CR=1 FL=1
MPYCKHCREEVDYDEDHNCRKRGLLRVDDDDSFIVSALIGLGTDSAIVGGLLGGSFLGGILGDSIDGDLMD